MRSPSPRPVAAPLPATPPSGSRAGCVAPSPRRGSASARAAAAALALALLGGCSVKAPPRASWTIVPDSPAPRAAAAEAGPALGLARFTAAPEIRRTDLTWRTDDGRRLTQSDDRWVDYPDRMLEEVVRAELLSSGRFSSVSPAVPAAGLDAVLQARVLDFTEWHVGGGGVEVRVAVEWRLTRPGGEILAQDVARVTEPLGERSVSGAVAAYQAGSRSLARDLVEAVATAARPLSQP